MSTKRQPSKQKRQTQNQRQRAALEARRVNAAAGEVPDGKTSGGGSGSSSSGGGSVLSRLRGASPIGRTVRSGTPASTPAGGQPVGYRAALSGLLAAVAAAIVGALLISIPVDASGEPVSSKGAAAGEWTLSAYDALQETAEATSEELADAVEDWTPNGEEPYWKAYWPISLGLLLPVVGAGLAFRAVSQRSGAKVVNRTMYATLFGTLLNAQVLFLFLPTVVAIGIAAFQVRKFEVATATAAAAVSGDGESGGDDEDDGIIDVDEATEVDEAIDAEEAVESDQLIEVDEAVDSVADEDDQRSV